MMTCEEKNPRMGEPTVTDLYQAELTDLLDDLEIEEIEWHHARWTQYGSEEDRNLLVKRCLAMPWAVIKKDSIPRDFVDDCIQAGNLAIFQAIETWSPRGGMAYTSWVWMYVRRAMMAERTRLNEMYDYVDYEILDFSEAIPDNLRNEDLERFSDAATMLELMEELSDRQRELLTHLMDGSTIAEAAKQMGIPRVSAYGLYGRALKKLCTLMVTK